MKKFTLVFTLVFILALTFPYQVFAAPEVNGRTVLGESYTLESGRILNGNLNVIGGVVEIEPGAAVKGDMFVVGSLVTIEGTVEGNLTAIGGTVNLEEDSLIKGDLISPASYINQKPGAEVQGEQISGWQIPWARLSPPFNYQPGFPRSTGIKIFPTLTKIGKEAGFTLLLVALGALMLLIMPKSSEVMTKALKAKPWHLFGFGALTAVVVTILVIFLMLTLCLAPVAILIGMAFGLAALAGWLALGYELGKRIAAGIFRTTWNPVLAAAMGNLVLYLMARGIRLIPCLGGFLGFLVMLFGLGMSVVTLLGTNPYPRQELAPVDEQIVLTSGAIESEIEFGAADEDIPPGTSEENTSEEPDKKEI